jgi:hypothetical protein
VSVATVSQVAASLGRPITSDSELVQIQTWLDDAEMQIRVRLGDVAALDQAAVAYVEREAVLLKVRNPEGKASEAIDDYRYQRTDSAAAGQVQILDEWWVLLSPTQIGGAFSITPYAAADTAAAPPTTTLDWS